MARYKGERGAVLLMLMRPNRYTLHCIISILIALALANWLSGVERGTNKARTFLNFSPLAKTVLIDCSQASNNDIRNHPINHNKIACIIPTQLDVVVTSCPAAAAAW